MKLDNIDRKLLFYGFTKVQENKAGVIYENIDNEEKERIDIANIYDGTYIENQYVDMYILYHNDRKVPLILDPDILKLVSKKAEKIKKESIKYKWFKVKEVINSAKNLDLFESDIIINNKNNLISGLSEVACFINAQENDNKEKDKVLKIITDCIRYIKKN